MTTDDNSTRAYRPTHWRRAVDIVLRTVHIAGAGILVGGHVYGVDAGRLVGALAVTVASGAGLIATEIWHSRHWPYQVRGILVMLKLAALGFVLVWWPGRVWVLLVVLAVGTIGSHVPRRYRHYSLVHRRCVD